MLGRPKKKKKIPYYVALTGLRLGDPPASTSIVFHTKAGLIKSCFSLRMDFYYIWYELP